MKAEFVWYYIGYRLSSSVAVQAADRVYSMQKVPLQAQNVEVNST